MQRFHLTLLTMALFSTSAAAQFDANSELLGASLRSWRSESTRDQMATVTNIVVKILNISDPIDARSKAINVHGCINKVAADFMAGERRVVDVAMTCIVQLGYLR
jgi:hypothetical protein